LGGCRLGALGLHYWDRRGDAEAFLASDEVVVVDPARSS